MKHFLRNIAIAIVTFTVVAVLLSLVSGVSAPGVAKVSVGVLAERINSGQVKGVVVSDDALTVEFKDGTKAESEKEAGVGLSEMLKNYGVLPEKLRAVDISFEDPSGARYWSSVLIPVLLPVVLMALLFFWMFRQANRGANQAMTFGKVNVRLFAGSKDKVTFKDIAGLREAKQELDEVVDFLKHPKKFLDIGAKIPRGVLLVGSPGTGKTMLARAVAGESGVPFFHLSASEFVEMFVGVGASRVRDLFQTAKRQAPSIVFIDEIDAVGRERGTGLGGGHDEREQTLNQILVEMDGFDRDTNVIVMAATNRADVLDSALLRPGRFDRRVVLDMPDLNDREEILKIHARGKPLTKEVNLRAVAVRTPGFSGADLANLLNEAAIFAARANRKQIVQLDILSSIEKVLLGPARTGRAISEREKRVTAYHEAGHALVAASLKDADPVHKVSIVSRGFAGGYTLHLPIEERRLKTRSQFLADLAVAFGGYAAEQLVFGDITTGSSNDIEHATEVAHRIVAQYGMSERLGPRSFGKDQSLTFLGKDIGSPRDYSENLGTVIDEEINSIIGKALATARGIITKQRKALDAIAERLLADETIEHEEFNELVGSLKVRPA